MVSAEMIGFATMHPTYIGAGVQFFTNNSRLNSISNIMRGQYIFTGSLSPAGEPDPYYEPVPLEQYAQFSFLSYFTAFIGILFLQSLTIFMTDIFVLKNMPSTVTIWERIVHAIQKSHLPFPIQNWHEGKGSCLDHIKRHKLAQKEVLTATVINLAFNMIMLIPLVILCKIKNLRTSLFIRFHKPVFQIKEFW